MFVCKKSPTNVEIHSLNTLQPMCTFQVHFQTVQQIKLNSSAIRLVLLKKKSIFPYVHATVKKSLAATILSKF